MIILRPARKNDLTALSKCAFSSGLGITHLPPDKTILEQKLQLSIDSFQKEVIVPHTEEYLFVLTDSKTDELYGTSAIFARTGSTAPCPSFRIAHILPLPDEFPPLCDDRLLVPEHLICGPTEIGGLYILPEHRKAGLGKLLSLSRFLFIHAFKNRFDSFIIANMRGIIKDNNSPFWDALGRRFINLELNEIMKMRIKSEAEIINLLPKYPIYANLLPLEARDVIGKVHPNTVSAYSMLVQEGFLPIQRIDPFDGGPFLGTESKNINTIKNSREALIKVITPYDIKSESFIISNKKIDFRACCGELKFHREDQVEIHTDLAEALELSLGDSIFYTTKC